MSDRKALARHGRPAKRMKPMCSGAQFPLLALMRDAYAKAEHARCRWRAAELAGDRVAAERARRLMLRHEAIAYHLDPNRGTM